MSEIYCKECAEKVSEEKDLEELTIGVGWGKCFVCGTKVNINNTERDFRVFREGTFKKICDKYKDEDDCDESGLCPFEDICTDNEYPDLNSPEAFRCDGKCEGCLYGVGCETRSPSVNPKDAWS